LVLLTGAFMALIRRFAAGFFHVYFIRFNVY